MEWEFHSENVPLVSYKHYVLHFINHNVLADTKCFSVVSKWSHDNVYSKVSVLIIFMSMYCVWSLGEEHTLHIMHSWYTLHSDSTLTSITTAHFVVIQKLQLTQSLDSAHLQSSDQCIGANTTNWSCNFFPPHFHSLSHFWQMLVSSVWKCGIYSCYWIAFPWWWICNVRPFN